MQIKVHTLPEPRMAYVNACFSNIFSTEPAFVQFVTQNVIYPVYKSNTFDLEPQNLCMSDIIRNHHNLKVGSSLEIKEYIPSPNITLKSIKFDMLKRKKNKTLSSRLNKNKQDKINIVSLHEKDVINVIKKNMSSHYFCANQICVISINNKIYTLIPTHIEGQGTITKSTKISVDTSDYKINLISSKLLKPELFQDDYKFENIGIGGLEREMISIFRDALCTRAYRPETIEKMGIKHVKGILLYGPPGTGKTLIARNIGSLISPVEPIVINGPELLNKYVGASEENIRKIFQPAEIDYQQNGNESMLHVIIFDEIDAICKSRGSGGSTRGDVTDSMVNQLLTKLDGYKELPNIFVIAMTNRKDLIDEALLRPGRIEKHIKVAFPNKEGREEIFRIHTKKMKINGMLSDDIDISKCAELTEGFTGSAIKAIVACAGSLALHSLIKNKKEIDDNEIVVNMKYMLDAIITVETSLNNSYLNVIKYLPDEFKILNDTYGKALETVKNFISYDDKTKRLKSLLLFGKNKTGKSTLLYHIACEKKIKCTKFVRAIDIIRKHEQDRSDYLIHILLDTHLVEQSLLVIDDLDIVINYSKYGHSIDYSRIIFQTLKTMLKTIPENKKNQLIIVCICGETAIKEMISNMFDETVNINTELDIFNDIGPFL